jgi:hypothetical protein
MVYLKQGRKSEALREYRALLAFDTGTAGALKKEIDGTAKERPAAGASR